MGSRQSAVGSGKCRVLREESESSGQFKLYCECLPTANSQQPTFFPHSAPSTQHSALSTFFLPTAHRQLPTAHCPLSFFTQHPALSFSPLPTANCQLSFFTQHSALSTFFLPTAHRQLSSPPPRTPIKVDCHWPLSIGLRGSIISFILRGFPQANYGTYGREPQ